MGAFSFPDAVHSQTTIHLNARDLQAKAELFFSPRTGSFTEGSIFEVPILIDTKGNTVNSLEINVQFDQTKLLVVNPSGGTSIIGLWIEPPKFDNSRGTIKLVGAIPNGIKTNSGLVATITFRAQASGAATLRFSSDSQVLLHDGQGTSADTTFGRAQYTIISKPPEGIAVFSETHPTSANWYNNNSPVFSWDSLAGADGYSFALDTSPLTIPANILMATTTQHGFENIADGLWYFHLKARRNGVWGNTTHFALKIDTTPPAAFTPEVNYITVAAAAYRGLVSFKTTDALSGIDHYEVGVLDADNESASPVFIQTESPYQVPINGVKMHVIVRAFDKAGNARDAFVDVDTSSLLAFITRNAWGLALGAIALTLLALIGVHYLVRHHLLRYARDAYRLFRREQKEMDMHNDSPSINIQSHREDVFSKPEQNP